MIVVDYNQTAIGSFMAEVRGRSDVEVSIPLLRHMIVNTIRSYKAKWGKDYGDLVIACDNRHYWRRDFYPYYKAGRKATREASGMDWNLIFESLNMVRDELAEVFPYPVIDVDGAEADDVIGTLAELSQTIGEPGPLFEDEIIPEPFLIVSGDHDFKQLQKFPNVKQWHQHKRNGLSYRKHLNNISWNTLLQEIKATAYLTCYHLMMYLLVDKDKSLFVRYC